MDNNISKMEIFIKDSTLMGYLKDLDNIYGRIKVIIREILSKG